jgi:hypothetical protein
MAGGGMSSFEASLIKSWYQSAQDGALPALRACFAPDAQSGDFYVPKGGATGPPVPSATAATFAKPFAERVSAHVPSREVLWSASEAAVGTFQLAA